MRTRLISRLVSCLILISLLIAGSMAVVAGAQASPAQSTTMSFAAVADATVKSSYPSTNFGTATTVSADASPTVHGYIRFSVSGLNGATITGAKLKLYARSGSSQSANIKIVSTDTWGETTITYGNAPAIGSTVANTPSSFASGTWVTVDVSSFVKGSGMWSLAITTPSSTVVNFATRETGSTAPKLVLTLSGTTSATATPGSTTNPTPTATTSGTSWQPSFPIRATFYYPWFPEAWDQNGIYPYTNYHPSLGYYSSADQTTLKKHISMMQYAKIQAGIASWWGQGSQTDAKIGGLLQAASGTNFRWALYYEMESHGDPTVSQINSDLTYIRDHYAGDPSFLKVNGKFVVFVYSDGTDACNMASRWKQANTVGAYVVLKVFVGYKTCSSQPNNWHQYSPAVAADSQPPYSYAISPGFWWVGHSVQLARDVTRFQGNVRDMVASGAQWQLVTTFDEWGEGTAVEPAQEWATSSGYGAYLDALHYNGVMP